MAEHQRVIGIHYTLTDDDGMVLDQSQDEPLFFLEGAGNIIPGLEKEVALLSVGEKSKVSVASDEGYGPYHKDLRFTLEKQYFTDFEPEVGQILEIGDDETQVQVCVVEVSGDTIHLDANHPLAGKTLHFDVEVTESRSATPQEISHGHPHLPGQSDH